MRTYLGVWRGDRLGVFARHTQRVPAILGEFAILGEMDVFGRAALRFVRHVLRQMKAAQTHTFSWHLST